MISPQFRPIVGGYERACERLSVALNDSGYNVAVFSEQRDKTWSPVDEISGVKIQRWWCIYKPRIHMITSLIGLVILLIRYGRDFHVWHVHQYGAHATLAVIMGKILRRPVILKLTSTGAQGLSATLSNAPLSTLQRWAHKRVAACVAVSKESTTEAIAFGIPLHRVVTITNGIDIKQFCCKTTKERFEIKIKLGLDPLKKICIYIGRLSMEKNPLCIIEAWYSIKSHLSEAWSLIFIGDGPLRVDLQNKIRDLKLTHDVHTIGETPSVSQWLAAADLFVLPSLNEGMANTLLEAMACGLPSIVTDVSGVDQLVRQPQTGLVVPINDTEALASALLTLHSDHEQRKKMGSRARKHMVANFSMDQISMHYQHLYERIFKEYNHA